MSAAWVWLGERPGLTDLMGAVVILAGLALILELPRRERTTPPALDHQGMPAP